MKLQQTVSKQFRNSVETVLKLFHFCYVVHSYNRGSMAIIRPEVAQTVQQHVSCEFIWIRRTCDCI